MLSFSRRSLGSIIQVRSLSQQYLATLKYIPQEQLVYKANEDDPTKHTRSHHGLFYLLPTDEKQLMKIYGLPSPFTNTPINRHNKILGMIPIMIRDPALEVFDIFKAEASSGDDTKRILIYGDHGHGKSNTLAHILHYIHVKQDRLVIYIRDSRKFSRRPSEIEASKSRPGRVDTPLDAAIFLQQFRVQNAQLLQSLRDKLVTSKEYKWSFRETTPMGEPIESIAEHGINRVVHASDCLAALINELMLACDQEKIKLLTVIDDIESLYEDYVGIMKHPDGRKVRVDQVTVSRALRKLVGDRGYKNGTILATCSDFKSRKQNQTPETVLSPLGLSHLEGYHGIQVPKFSLKEFGSYMNFLQDIGWLGRPQSKTQEARDEIRFMSGLNPLEIHELCKSI